MRLSALPENFSLGNCLFGNILNILNVLFTLDSELYISFLIRLETAESTTR